MHEHVPAATPIRLPSTLQGCRERLAALQDEIASIRIQIATTDIRRQTEKKSLDATWFHRAKTALRTALKVGRQHLPIRLAADSGWSWTHRTDPWADAP